MICNNVFKIRNTTPLPRKSSTPDLTLAKQADMIIYVETGEVLTV
jgi:hypothetical protein